jgi:hypothetical protein
MEKITLRAKAKASMKGLEKPGKRRRPKNAAFSLVSNIRTPFRKIFL